MLECDVLAIISAMPHCYQTLLKGRLYVWASQGKTVFLKESIKANIENMWGGPPVSESVFITVIVQEGFLLANVSCPMQIV